MLKYNKISPALEKRIKGKIYLLNNKFAYKDAEEELLKIGSPAIPYLKNAPAGERVRRTLNMLELRVKLSDKLLKWYPDICRDLTNPKNDAHAIFMILHKLVEMNRNRVILHKDEVEDSDVAMVIGELMSKNWDNFQKAEKQSLIVIATGGEFTLGYRGTDVSYHSVGALTLGWSEGGGNWEDEIDYEIKGGWSGKDRKGVGAIPHIEKLLRDDDSDVRWLVAHVLAKLDARWAIQDIKQLLKDNNSSVRQSAEDTLRWLGVSKEEIEKLKN